MASMGKIWRHFGLVRVSGDAGDKVLDLQFRHLKKNIPWLYLVMTFDIASCVYAVTDSSSVILRVIIPIIVISAIACRMIWWLRHRNETFESERALKLIKRTAVAATVIGSLCALWSVLAWQSETGNFRYYIPAFMALGAFSTAYCLSPIPRCAILCVLIGVMPICSLLLMSGVIIDFALAMTMLACTLFLIGLVQRQHRNVLHMIDMQIEMHKMAHTDALTGLQNRRAFHEQLDTLLPQSSAGKDVTLALIDLDGFKLINDRYGHLAGDCVLQTVAERLRESVGEFAIVSRIGGDEFAIMFENENPTLCGQLMEAAVKKLELPIDIDGVQVKVGASFGLTSLDGTHYVRPIDLISATDVLLYEKKKHRTGPKLLRDERSLVRSEGKAA